MAGLPEHLASFARFATHRERREREDASALAELTQVPIGLPAGLEIEWLGTAGYRLTFEGETLYIDPYVSRVGVRDLVRKRVALADPALHDRWLTPPGPVAGVLVGHTHFDHAIDIPELCRRTGAKAYGSASLAQLMRAFGQADQCVEVTPAQAYELGPFTVRFHLTTGPGSFAASSRASSSPATSTTSSVRSTRRLGSARTSTSRHGRRRSRR